MVFKKITNFGKLIHSILPLTLCNSEDDTSPDNKHYLIGKTFYPVIIAMKLWGITPLEVVGRGESFTPGTIGTVLWTLSLIGIFLIILIVYALNSFGIPWPAQMQVV